MEAFAPRAAGRDLSGHCPRPSAAMRSAQVQSASARRYRFPRFEDIDGVARQAVGKQ